MSSLFSGPGLSGYYLGRWWSPGQRALCLLFLPVSSFIPPSFPPVPFPIHPSIRPSTYDTVQDMWWEIYKMRSLPFKNLQSRKTDETQTHIKQSRRRAGPRSRAKTATSIQGRGLADVVRKRGEPGGGGEGVLNDGGDRISFSRNRNSKGQGWQVGRL